MGSVAGWEAGVSWIFFLHFFYCSFFIRFGLSLIQEQPNFWRLELFSLLNFTFFSSIHTKPPPPPTNNLTSTPNPYFLVSFLPLIPLCCLSSSTLPPDVIDHRVASTRCTWGLFDHNLPLALFVAKHSDLGDLSELWAHAGVLVVVVNDNNFLKHFLQMSFTLIGPFLIQENAIIDR